MSQFMKGSKKKFKMSRFAKGFVANKYGEIGEKCPFSQKMCPKIKFFGKNGIKRKVFEGKL